MNMNKKRWEPVAEVSKGTTVLVPNWKKDSRTNSAWLPSVALVLANLWKQKWKSSQKIHSRNLEPQRKPVIVDHDRHRIDIKWNPPEDDGGAPIKGYHVERKEPKGQRWLRLTKVPQTNLDFSDDGVREGKEYEYRVIAVNEAGPGDPSPPSDLVVAKPSREAPKLNLKELPLGLNKEIRLRAGEPLHIPVPITGAPKPKVTWTKDNGSLPNNAQVLDEEERTCVDIPRTVRGDSGDYKLKLVNDYGQDEATIKVIVMDPPGPPENLKIEEFDKRSVTLAWKPPKDDGGNPIQDVPGPPEGPLEATDVNADEMTLKWKPPLDDGGQPISNYILEKRVKGSDSVLKPPLDDGGQPISNYILEKRVKGSDSWQKVSNFLNTPTATVRNLEVGREYEFRVMAENAMGPGEPLMTTQAIKAKHPYDPPSGMSKPTVEDTTDDSVTLAWEPPRKGPTTGYVVEKRPKGSRDWTKANTTNVTGTNYTVKGLPKGKEFEFRVVPYNLAGLGEPSEPTDVTKVQFPTAELLLLLRRSTVYCVDSPGVSVRHFFFQCHPKISRDVPREIIAHVDEPFKIRIPFTGSPPTKVEVTKDGIPVPLEGGRFKVEVTPDEVIITDLNAEKNDAGQYKIDLENEKGKDSVPVAVKVVGPPEPPRGPLDVSNVKSDSCTLSWNPPAVTTADSPGSPVVEDVGKDFVDLSWSKPLKDGGARITGYVIEKRKKFAADWEPAMPDGQPVSGTQAHVDKLDENAEYEFRVRAVNAAGPGEPSLPTELTKVCPKRDKPKPPEDLEVTEVFADNCKLHWNPPEFDGGCPITGEPY
ncbi:hypothetical protein AHF37_07761 [Paragonimus kellicotti]|nr:hypothetical protein AHF37_07761 [Paragonimus kellicotti]